MPTTMSSNVIHVHVYTTLSTHMLTFFAYRPRTLNPSRKLNQASYYMYMYVHVLVYISLFINFSLWVHLFGAFSVFSSDCMYMYVQ